MTQTSVAEQLGDHEAILGPIMARYTQRRDHHLSQNLGKWEKEALKPQLTGHTLAGDGKVNLRSESIYLIDDHFITDYKDIDVVEDHQWNHSYTFFHLGPKLSGHKGIVHGGFLATVLDELTCRLAFQNFHSKKGVTANLNINYKQPCFVDNYVLVRCVLLDKHGRKCRVKGTVYKVNIEDEEIETKENLLCECECLVIEPRWVDKLGEH